MLVALGARELQNPRRLRGMRLFGAFTLNPTCGRLLSGILGRWTQPTYSLRFTGSTKLDAQRFTIASGG